MSGLMTVGGSCQAWKVRSCKYSYDEGGGGGGGGLGAGGYAFDKQMGVEGS